MPTVKARSRLVCGVGALAGVLPNDYVPLAGSGSNATERKGRGRVIRQGERAILRDLQNASRYAQQRGVVIVAAAGNEAQDLSHPVTDDIRPDWPPDTAVVRDVGNNCRVAPAELPGVVTVSASGVSELAG